MPQVEYTNPAVSVLRQQTSHKDGPSQGQVLVAQVQANQRTQEVLKEAMVEAELINFLNVLMQDIGDETSIKFLVWEILHAGGNISKKSKVQGGAPPLVKIKAKILNDKQKEISDWGRLGTLPWDVLNNILSLAYDIRFVGNTLSFNSPSYDVLTASNVIHHITCIYNTINTYKMIYKDLHDESLSIENIQVDFTPTQVKTTLLKIADQYQNKGQWEEEYKTTFAGLCDVFKNSALKISDNADQDGKMDVWSKWYEVSRCRQFIYQPFTRMSVKPDKHELFQLLENMNRFLVFHGSYIKGPLENMLTTLKIFGVLADSIRNYYKDSADTRIYNKYEIIVALIDNDYVKKKFDDIITAYTNLVVKEQLLDLYDQIFQIEPGKNATLQISPDFKIIPKKELKSKTIDEIFEFFNTWMKALISPVLPPPTSSSPSLPSKKLNLKQLSFFILNTMVKIKKYVFDATYYPIPYPTIYLTVVIGDMEQPTKLSRYQFCTDGKTIKYQSQSVVYNDSDILKIIKPKCNDTCGVIVKIDAGKFKQGVTPLISKFKKIGDVLQQFDELEEKVSKSFSKKFAAMLLTTPEFKGGHVKFNIPKHPYVNIVRIGDQVKLYRGRKAIWVTVKRVYKQRLAGIDKMGSRILFDKDHVYKIRR